MSQPSGRPKPVAPKNYLIAKKKIPLNNSKKQPQKEATEIIKNKSREEPKKRGKQKNKRNSSYNPKYDSSKDEGHILFQSESESDGTLKIYKATKTTPPEGKTDKEKVLKRNLVTITDEGNGSTILIDGREDTVNASDVVSGGDSKGTSEHTRDAGGNHRENFDRGAGGANGGNHDKSCRNAVKFDGKNTYKGEDEDREESKMMEEKKKDLTASLIPSPFFFDPYSNNPRDYNQPDPTIRKSLNISSKTLIADYIGFDIGMFMKCYNLFGKLHQIILSCSKVYCHLFGLFIAFTPVKQDENYRSFFLFFPKTYTEEEVIKCLKQYNIVSYFEALAFSTRCKGIARVRLRKEVTQHWAFFQEFEQEIRQDDKIAQTLRFVRYSTNRTSYLGNFFDSDRLEKSERLKKIKKINIKRMSFCNCKPMMIISDELHRKLVEKIEDENKWVRGTVKIKAQTKITLLDTNEDSPSMNPFNDNSSEPCLLQKDESSKSMLLESSPQGRRMQSPKHSQEEQREEAKQDEEGEQSEEEEEGPKKYIKKDGLGTKSINKEAERERKEEKEKEKKREENMEKLSHFLGVPVGEIKHSVEMERLLKKIYISEQIWKKSEAEVVDMMINRLVNKLTVNVKFVENQKLIVNDAVIIKNIKIFSETDIECTNLENLFGCYKDRVRQKLAENFKSYEL